MPDNFTQFIRYMQDESTFCGPKEETFARCASARLNTVARGLYAPGLRKWHEVFGKENVLVLDMDGDQADNTRKILQHTGLPTENYPFMQQKATSFKNEKAYASGYSGRAEAWAKHAGAMQYLLGMYRQSNIEVNQLLNVSWGDLWNKKPKAAA